MSALERLAPWSTTGVGSLPHADAGEAAAHAVASYDLPFCPQLPRLEGDMLAEWLGGDPRRCGWSPERDRERPRAWNALLSELAARPPAHGLVKLQVTGPVTLTLALQRAGGSVPATDLGLRREVALWLAANVAGQVRTLRNHDLAAIVVVDEPALAASGGGPVPAWDPFRAIGAAWGLHVCCAVPWDVIDRAEPDVLSFDLALEAPARRATLSLRRQFARGGRVAWGVLAPHREERVTGAATRIPTALAAVGIDRDAVAAASLLTPACGSGRVSPVREQELAHDLNLLAACLRIGAPLAGAHS